MSTIVLNRVGRPLLLGALFYLFHWGAYGAYMPFLTVYFAKLGFSGGQFGLLAMLFPLGILLCSPPLSALADRTHSRMRLLQLALTGVVLTFLMLGYPTRFGTVAVVMGVLAIVRSPVLALADTLIVQLAVRNGIHYGNLRLVGLMPQKHPDNNQPMKYRFLFGDTPNPTTPMTSACGVPSTKTA